MKNKKLTSTTVAPVGIFTKKEINIPQSKAKAALSEDKKSALLKLRAICRAVTAGRIRRDEISIIPTTRTERTTVMAVRITRRVFIFFVETPLICASCSLNESETRS